MLKHHKITLLGLISFGVVLFGLASAWANKQTVTYLDQNWTQQDRAYFYYADQGSRLIPYDYFLHLEQAQSTDLFRADQNMKRLGLIPASPSENNPDGLPIGLTRNDDFMGPTCAACHTQQVTYQGETIHIDGGQGFIHLNQFLSDITAALKATLDNSDKFARFQQRLLGDKASANEVEALRGHLKKTYEKRQAHMFHNHADIVSGYSRLDAFGAILNQALLATGVAGNRNSPNAPTSIPYIWDTPQHDYVEWNGSQSNTGVGALARNVGEVIGVFGDIDTETTTWLGLIDGGYSSSIQTRELRKLERVVSQLQSPQWPEAFPAIDQKLAKQGRALYQQHCVACHLDIDRTDPKRTIQVRMSSVGEIKTDPLMAENAIKLKGQSGKFEGRPRYYFTGDPLPSEAPAIHIANNVMVGIIKNNPVQAYLAKRDAKKLGHPDVTRPPKYVDGKIIEQGQEVSDHALLAYKARPLNGVWTSAPFLHNGSVANLYELLLPAKDRMKQFSLGSWEFDPKHVGYVLDAKENDFLFDTSIPGNSNAGHEYGTGYYGETALSEEQRWALVEYLKTL